MSYSCLTSSVRQSDRDGTAGGLVVLLADEPRRRGWVTGTSPRSFARALLAKQELRRRG